MLSINRPTHIKKASKTPGSPHYTTLFFLQLQCTDPPTYPPTGEGWHTTQDKEEPESERQKNTNQTWFRLTQGRKRRQHKRELKCFLGETRGKTKHPNSPALAPHILPPLLRPLAWQGQRSAGLSSATLSCPER